MSNDDNVIDLAVRAKKMQNLRPYRGKTLEEIEEILRFKDQKPKAAKAPSSNKKTTDDYDKRFNAKLNDLQKEFSLDMNDSNDRESLMNLVRLQIQNENIARDIDNIQRKEVLRDEDYRSLKTLGDFQVGVQRSIAEIQDKLGITRKIRKEKQVDDFPQFIDSLLKRGNALFEATTTKIMCPKCMIELGRFWLNFPKENNEIQASLTCWKCKESVEYAR
jgi:hypothetical protein